MDAQLDMRMLALARQVHGDVVPVGAALGTIGDDAERPLAIYEMDKLPGDNYAMVRRTLVEERQSQLAAVRSLASFFAQAWRSPVALDRRALSAVATELSSRLDDVSSSGVLTARFQPALEEVREHLPTLVSGDFPLVLTHSDLNELNILVDGSSGAITGVIDWADAGIQPFGLTLYVLEKFIGSMGSDGWVYLDNAGALREEFWRAFTHYAGQVSDSHMKAIQVARKAGYLLRYGTFYSREHKGAVGIETMSTEKRRLYLEAIL
ncbi:Protein kinase-like domain protein [Niveomyces insectorum RCEF 264]|uniref:Protein kinase-like domain protein n=1 Tax=Niveomyces insectorum RCEF 264 TaxID=1081102 RepID=A0A167VIP6_9HYPO|nr:Protein kinase-like domain protein [Niveomyces insectorum RCEF 264]